MVIYHFSISGSKSFLQTYSPYLLLSELFLWGRRGVLWSSPTAGEGGRGGGPGRPGGRGGAPPPVIERELGEEETEEEGFELKEGGGGGGKSRGIDGL